MKPLDITIFIVTGHHRTVGDFTTDTVDGFVFVRRVERGGREGGGTKKEKQKEIRKG